MSKASVASHIDFNANNQQRQRPCQLRLHWSESENGLGARWVEEQQQTALTEELGTADDDRSSPLPSQDDHRDDVETYSEMLSPVTVTVRISEALPA